jgi:hypothetical protein
MIGVTIINLILAFCTNIPDTIKCEDDLNRCIDQKVWEYLDYSVNSDIPNQYYIDSFNECKEQVR